MTTTFTERYRQARLYAAQVRVRREMGDRYICAKPLTRPTIRRSRYRESLTDRFFNATIC